ncbi:MAG: hypothetical protein OJF49_002734 [Ktedonobacterales bacterium]|nr:MAG: hypothetical protein OJF49_002734 [Ktedonobacterales bacterium]
MLRAHGRLTTLIVATLILVGAMAFGGIKLAGHVSAASDPGRIVPYLTECQSYGWQTIVTNNWTDSPYTEKLELQQAYDSNFGAWCYHFRSKVTISAGSGNYGATLKVDAANCGSKGNEQTATLPSGSFSGKYYYSGAYNAAPSANGWFGLYPSGSTIEHYGTCGGNY